MTGGRPRVFVVEDDPDILDTLAEVLEDRGFTVGTAVNGADALAKLREASERPEVIVLDLMMPVMDGWQFRSAQRADPRLAEIPVVLISAHVDARDVAAKLELAGWVQKPIDLERLTRILSDVRARPRSDP